jgi:dihydrolipoamide dehydrogenase
MSSVAHMYTHAGDDAAAGEPERGMDWRVVPRPVYATPETASIGLLESEAQAQGLAVDVARVCYRDIARAVIQGETAGFAKIIAEGASSQILGAAIVGAQACELIGEIAVAADGQGGIPLGAVHKRHHV